MGKPRRRKDGRWIVEVELPKKPTGERNRKYIFGRTKADCTQNEFEFRQSLEEQKILNSKDITVAEYMKKWLEINCAQLSPTTVSGYKVYIDLHIIPKLGSLKMREIVQMTVQNFINEFSATRRSKSSKNLKGILNKAFNDAVDNNIIKYNPCGRIKIKASKAYEYYIYNEEEFNKLLNAVKGTTDEMPIILAALCGMRAGEIMGLTWENVDLDSKTININQTAIPVDGNIIIKEPKTRSSNRKIECPDYVIEVLKKHKKSSGFVYSKKDGSPENRNAFYSRFQDLLANNNLPRIRFHDLRHFNATMMLKLGISDKEAAARLGHSEINMTKKYQHVLKSMESRAANMLNSIVGGQNGSQNSE